MSGLKLHQNIYDGLAPLSCILVFLSFNDFSKLWPPPRSFSLGLGLGLKVLAAAWPRSRCLIM